jgi:hypothetical protein
MAKENDDWGEEDLKEADRAQKRVVEDADESIYSLYSFQRKQAEAYAEAKAEEEARRKLAEAEEEEAENTAKAGKKKSKSIRSDAKAEEDESKSEEDIADAEEDEAGAIKDKARSEREETSAEEERDQERWKWEQADRKKAARRETAEDVASAARAGLGAARAVGSRGYDLASFAAGVVKPSGTVIFFLVAMLAHIVDALTDFGKSNSGITGLRFGLYVLLMLYAWLAFYGGGKGGLESLGKPAIVSALSFLLPLLVSLILKISMPTNMQNTITALLVFIPLWPIIAAFGLAPDDSKFFMVMRLIFIAIWVLAALPTLYTSYAMDLNLGESKINALNAIRFVVSLIIKNVLLIWNGLKSLPNTVWGGVNTQIQYATGDYYTGMVDNNQKEPIGVYLENIQAANTRFFEGESVTIWGVIRAKTMDPEKSISIKTACYAETEGSVNIPSADGLPVSMIKVSGDADPTGPEKTFNMKVTVMEEKDLSCEFVPDALKEGSWTAYFSSTFNFDTYSYLKTYFMDEDRLRAIRRQNKDPLDEYSISDKNPVAIYTQGPIMIGMAVTQPLVGLNRNDKNELRLGITLENQWEGNLKSINDLSIKLPPSMSIAFCDYNIKSDACREDECENGKYTVVYRLQDKSESGKRGKDGFDDLGIDNSERSKSINCKINVDNADSALGSSPISTHYFKVSADYIYELKGSTQISVEKSTLSPAPNVGG